MNSNVADMQSVVFLQRKTSGFVRWLASEVKGLRQIKIIAIISVSILTVEMHLICVTLKVAAVAQMRRRMLWEAGLGPGGSSLTSRGKTCLCWAYSTENAWSVSSQSQSETLEERCV